MNDQERDGFSEYLSQRVKPVEACLDSILGDIPLDDEISRPKKLLDAMRHGALNGGKRLRPFLVLESTALFNGRDDLAIRVGTALECIHCYSLIHDDLPAMDDDDVRRGKPTVHKAFDEATAILAGDSLLTLAFDIIASPETELVAPTKVSLITALARASGLGGMAGGQVLDLAAEHDTPDEAGIVTLQAMKTGALIRFACEAGAIITGASDEERTRLAEFGSAIGLAFQLADDLLDELSDAEAMGKATGKDANAGKATLVSLHGVDWAKKQLTGLIGQASELLEPFGKKAGTLRNAASFVAHRRS